MNDPLIDALTNISITNPAGAKTARELCRELGISEGTLKRRLQDLAFENRLECVKIRSVSISGVPCHIPAYRLRAEPSGIAKEAHT